jgi:sugar lactone lactonase YvrE
MTRAEAGGSWEEDTRGELRLHLGLAVWRAALIVMFGVLTLLVAVGGGLVWASSAMAAGQPGERYEEAVRADGPVAWYRFADAPGSGTLADSAGSYAATNHGITLGEAGPFAGTGSGVFGGEAYGTLPSNPLASTSAFTAEAWIRRGGAINPAIFDFGSSSTNYMYLTPYSSGSHKTLFEIRSGSTEFQVVASHLAEATWEYVVVTETSSGTLTLYLNGVQAGQTTGVTISPASLGSTPDDYLGKSITENPLFHGRLSNVAFYSKALSPERILAHYQAAAPVDTSPPAITGTVQQNKTLTAKAGSWSGLEPITFKYQWLRCDSAGGECKEISSATTTKYTPGNEEVGKTLRIAVTASDGAGSVNATSEATAPVKGIKPSYTSLPAISGSDKVGDLLNASTGSWEGTTPLSYTYEWEACGPGACRHIAGATAASYRVQGAQLEKTVRVIVTASNVAGSASATSEKTVAVSPGLPVNTYPPGVFGTADAGETLSASTGAWAGSEPFSYLYQWQSCNGSGEACLNISGATEASYVATSSNVGHTLRVIVTAKNAAGEEAVTSPPSLLVQTPPPANTHWPSLEGSAREGTALTASAGAWSGVEPISFSYQWQRCSTQALGAAGTANGEFESPGDVAVDSDGNLWVADTGNDRVEEFNERGEYLRQFGSEGSGNGQLSEPSALAISPEGDIWVADTGNDRLEKFSPHGEYLGQIAPVEGEPGELEEPEGIAIDRDGDIWVSDTVEGRLVEFDAQGQYLRTLGSEGSKPGQIGEPEGMAVDSQGHIWVADWSNDRVEEFNEQGEYLREFGTQGAGAGQFENPFGIAVSANGKVWVGDVGGDRLEEFSEEGEYLRQFGSRGSGAGQLNLVFPMGIAIVQDGALWLTDTANNRLQRFNEHGEYLGSNCVPITGATESSYSPTAADVGFMLQAVVTATDADGTAAVLSPPSAVVVPSPPANILPPSIEGVAEEGQTLTASNGRWSGTSLIYTYQWQSCNAAGEACSNIESAESASYVVGDSEAGRTLRVVVSAENTTGRASAASAPSAVVIAGPPVNTDPPVIEGIARVGRTLSASTGGWLGTAPISYAFQWQSCDALGESCMPIPSATNSTYAVGSSDLGMTLGVAVTAVNIAGEATASSAKTAEVSSSMPENTTLPSISGTAREGETLSASLGVWTGAEPISYSYQWQRCSPGMIGSEGSAHGQLNRPGDVAVDPSGDLWVLDTGNDRVVEFSEHGEYLGEFGSPGSAPGELSEPSALAMTPEGDILVADTGNDRIEKFSASGELIMQIEPPESEPDYLEEPEGVAVDRDGDVWVSDTARGELIEFNEEGEYIRTVGSEGRGPAQLGEPEGITIDGQGHVWVADWSNHRVEEWSEDGAFLEEFAGVGSGQLEDPYGIAVSAGGHVWVGDLGDDSVKEFNEHGESLRQFGAPGSAPGEFGLGFPMGLAPVAGGELWLTDAENDRLERFNEEGEYVSGPCIVISGTAGSTYTATAADVGFILRVVVTATNAEGEASATSAPTNVIEVGSGS